MTIKNIRGFSLAEIVVVVAILALITVLALFSFGAFSAKQALDKDSLTVLATLNDARSKTLSSQGAAQYGVHLEEFRAVLFRGSSYSSSDPQNEEVALSGYSRISGINLAGGASDIIFSRLTGATGQNGTIVLSLRNDNTTTRTITVYATGIIEYD